MLLQLYPHVKECKYCKVCVPDRLLAQSKARQLLQQLAASSSHSINAHSSVSIADDIATEATQGLHLDLTGLGELDRQDLQMVQQLLPRWAADNMTAESLQQMAAASRKLAQHLGGKLEYDIAPLEKDIWGVQDHKQCVICRGCKQVLEPMPTGTEMLGSYYTHEQVGCLAGCSRHSNKVAFCWRHGAGGALLRISRHTLTRRKAAQLMLRHAIQ